MGRIKIKKSRLVVLLVLILYLGAVLAATLYSQTGYIESLPEVTLTKPGPAEIPFTLEGGATVQDGELYYHHPSGLGLPNDVIVPGLAATLSKADGRTGAATVRDITGDDVMGGAKIWFTIDEGDFEEGETVHFTVDGRTITFRKTVPRSALHQNYLGQPVLYTIATTDGPWGTRFTLKENITSIVWPYNSESEYVLVTNAILNSGEPVVLASKDSYLYHGMEVRLGRG